MGGVVLDDPYRWMENANDPDWLSYAQAQDAYARGIFARIRGRSAIARELSSMSEAAPKIWEMRIIGDQLFIKDRPLGASGFRLTVRPLEGGPARVLIDPDSMPGEQHTSLDWWEPSTDGGHVAYGLSKGGSEDAMLHVLETRTGRVLPDTIRRAQYAWPSWLPDGSGFFYNQLNTKAVDGADPTYNLNSRALLHRLGTDSATDPVIFAAGLHPGIDIAPVEFPSVVVTPGSDWVLAQLIRGVAPEIRLFAARLKDVLAEKPGWREVARSEDQVTQAVVRGDRLYLLTFSKAPRFRVQRTEFPDASAANARVVVPEGERVIFEMDPALNGIYLFDSDGGVERLRRLDNEDRLHDVRTPPQDGILISYSTPTREGIYVSVENIVTPARIFAIDAQDDARPTDLVPQPKFDVSKYRQSRAVATARDGTRIPITIAHRADVRRDGSAPTIVVAYGAAGQTLPLNFNTDIIPWIERGGVYAIAHVRGGGDYGEDWHRQGQKSTKPNSWRDLIACCEQLIAEKWTSSAKLAIMGKSAGGITIANAMAERPDLMAVVLARVPMVNTTRVAAISVGPGNFSEYGDPSKPEEVPGLIAMDAYHHLKKGISYPAVLLTGGLHDSRVPAWQPGKLAARLNEFSSSGKPILFRVERDAGHGLGSTRQQVDSEFTDLYAFALWQMGILKLN